MASSNDGGHFQGEFYPRLPNQDRKHFPLGTSTARPAARYFAEAAGLWSERPIQDAVAGLSDEREILAALFNVLRSYSLAREYMKWRMKI